MKLERLRSILTSKLTLPDADRDHTGHFALEADAAKIGDEIRAFLAGVFPNDKKAS